GRPDLVGNAKSGTSAPFNFLNLSAFAAPCTWDPTLAGGDGDCVPGTQHFGNVGRNSYRGPNYANFDFGLSKNTKLTERVSMQLRLDIFNILNHPNFSNPLLPNLSVDMFHNGCWNGKSVPRRWWTSQHAVRIEVHFLDMWSPGPQRRWRCGFLLHGARQVECRDASLMRVLRIKQRK